MKKVIYKISHIIVPPKEEDPNSPFDEWMFCIQLIQENVDILYIPFDKDKVKSLLENASFFLETMETSPSEKLSEIFSVDAARRGKDLADDKFI